jgi:hypothetical protein
LNARLADELTAVNQYMVHAEMCDNWGYERLHEGQASTPWYVEADGLSLLYQGLWVWRFLD